MSTCTTYDGHCITAAHTGTDEMQVTGIPGIDCMTVDAWWLLRGNACLYYGAEMPTAARAAQYAAAMGYSHGYFRWVVGYRLYGRLQAIRRRGNGGTACPRTVRSEL
jgi:hypothetical protein